MNKNKPCPACGHPESSCDGHYFVCDNCGKRAPSVYPVPDREQAEILWNSDDWREKYSVPPLKPELVRQLNQYAHYLGVKKFKIYRGTYYYLLDTETIYFVTKECTDYHRREWEYRIQPCNNSEFDLACEMKQACMDKMLDQLLLDKLHEAP
jgi:hypothetical protein